jgi:hypothetical protein
VDLTCLIGKKIDLKLGWGDLTGRLTEVRMHEFEIDGETFSIPRHLIVEAQEYNFDEVRHIRVIEE